MIPLKAAIRAQSRRSAASTSTASTCTICRLPLRTTSITSSSPHNHTSATKILSTRTIATSANRLGESKKWTNQIQNKKASEEEGKADLESSGKTSGAVVDVKGKGKEIENEVIPEENGVADEGSPSSTSDESIRKPQTEAEVVSSSSSSSKPSSTSSASAAAAPPSSSSSGGDEDASSYPTSSIKPPSSGKEITKPSIPEIYPQVLALPITRRPLFPGFYKAVTITSPTVIAAIRTLLQRGQPYIGAFLLKDSESDQDVINSMDEVYPVGVFAQITSVFSNGEGGVGTPASALAGGAPMDGKSPLGGGEKKPETLTAVLYPHRRIRIDQLITQPFSGEAPPPPTMVGVTETQEPSPVAPEEKPEGEVASFEKESTPSVEDVKQDLSTSSSSDPSSSASFEESTKASTTAPTPPPSNISFLHPMLPNVSLTNVTNLQLEPFKKDSQVVRAVMSELISVFKDIAQLQPIFREQSESRQYSK